MSRWANIDVRRQREKVVIDKYNCGWRLKDIASYVGIASGSVSHIIKAYLKRRAVDVPTAQE